MPTAFVNAVQSLTARKQRLATQERDLVSALNRALARVGYQVVARSASSAPARVSRKTAARRRRKPLVCPHCDRRFAQPVHLGRHVSATHKAEKKVVALTVVKSKARGKKAKKATGVRPAKAAGVSVKKAPKPPVKGKAALKKAAAKTVTAKPTNSGTEGATK